MLQQINLYKLLPVKSRYQLTQSMALAIYGIFLFFLLSIYGVELEEKHLVNVKYTALNNQVNLLKQRLNLLTQKFPVSDAAALKQNLENLHQQYATKVAILNLLTQQSNFSTYLLGFANINMKDAWLTEIIVDNMNDTLDLKGYALQSSQVDQYLIQLESQPTFSALKFELKNIAEYPEPPIFNITAKSKVLL